MDAVEPSIFNPLCAADSSIHLQIYDINKRNSARFILVYDTVYVLLYLMLFLYSSC